MYRGFDHVSGEVGEGVGDKVGKKSKTLVVLPGASVADHVKDEVNICIGVFE